jgi:hypothetical protein
MAVFSRVVPLFVLAWLVLLDTGARATELEIWYYQCMEDEESF